MSGKFVAQLAGCGKEAKAEGTGAFLEQQLVSNCIKNHGSTALGANKFSEMSRFKIAVKAIVINNHCFYCSILLLRIDFLPTESVTGSVAGQVLQEAAVPRTTGICEQN